MRIPEEPPGASARDILDTEMTMEEAENEEDVENYAPDTFVHALGVCHRLAVFETDDDDETPSRVTAVISQLDIVRFLHRRAVRPIHRSPYDPVRVVHVDP